MEQIVSGNINKSEFEIVRKRTTFIQIFVKLQVFCVIDVVKQNGIESVAFYSVTKDAMTQNLAIYLNDFEAYVKSTRQLN